ncbi:GNAT family N-acetyltransferase [Oscillatoria sp. FACHB-1407]|nr:GNAT family N-acetyltransferase [Oscillatoria sp. FACHB-1407]
MQRTYQESHPGQSVAHLAHTVEQYLSKDTPLWWVETVDRQTVGCLWMGSAIDQISGDRQSYIFLLYVTPEHRRRGIGKALMHHAETWVKSRGDRQLGLQVFPNNQPALNLYRQLGYEVQSLWMVKRLEQGEG